MKKMKTDKVSDEQMQDLFTEAFEKVASLNDIDEFECTCKREVGSTDILMEVMVVGMAGSPNYESFHGEEIEELENITISRDSRENEAEQEVLGFDREPSGDYVVNTNDYVVAYKSN